MTNESVRFQTLAHILRSERQSVGVTIAAMAFINVLVHCVPDMNFQVYLQFEFTKLGINATLEVGPWTVAAGCSGGCSLCKLYSPYFQPRTFFAGASEARLARAPGAN